MPRIPFKIATPEIKWRLFGGEPRNRLEFIVSGMDTYEENRNILLQVGIDERCIEDPDEDDPNEDEGIAVRVVGMYFFGLRDKKAFETLQGFKSHCLAFQEASEVIAALEKLPFNMDVRAELT